MTLRAIAIAAFVLANVFAPMLGGSDVTAAAFSDTEAGVAEITANVTIRSSCVFWATSPTDSQSFKITGGSHFFDGCVHSNKDLVANGNNNIFNRTVRYASTFSTNHNGHEFRQGVNKTTLQPYPNAYAIARYAPGGAAAEAAAVRGEYFVHTGNVNLQAPLLRTGLHYVQGNVNFGNDCTLLLGGECATDRITVVATGSITAQTSHRSYQSYMDGLLFLSNQSTTSNTIKLGGSGNTYTGVIYAPRGEAMFACQYTTLIGQLAGKTVQVAGSYSTFIGRSPSVIAAMPGGGPTAATANARTPAVEESQPDWLDLPSVQIEGLPEGEPSFVSVGDFAGDGVERIARGYAMKDGSVILVLDGQAPMLFAAPPNPTIDQEAPILNGEFDHIWMTEETVEEPALGETIIELVFDSTGSIAPGLTEQEGDRPAAFWTYRAFSGEHHPAGQAKGGGQRVAIVVDPRDAGPDKAILAQAVGQRPHLGQWRDPTSVVVNVEAVYNANISVRAAYYAVEDPKIIRVSDLVTLTPFVDERNVTFTFAPTQKGTMTEFMLIFEVGGLQEGAIVLDSVEVLGATREIAFSVPNTPVT